MSRDYYVYCVTCKDRHEFNDSNHQDAFMHALVRHRLAIAGLVELFAETNLELKVGEYYNRVDPSWFRAHAGHELAVIDEYGKIDGKCAKDFVCGRCRSRHHCELERGHAGECGRLP